MCREWRTHELDILTHPPYPLPRSSFFLVELIFQIRQGMSGSDPFFSKYECRALSLRPVFERARARDEKRLPAIILAAHPSGKCDVLDMDGCMAKGVPLLHRSLEHTSRTKDILEARNARVAYGRSEVAPAVTVESHQPSKKSSSKTVAIGRHSYLQTRATVARRFGAFAA